MKCSEYDLSKVAKIQVYKYTDRKLTVPVYIPVLACTASSVPSSDLLTKISFERDSVKLDDKENVSVSGVKHTITFSWKWKPRTLDDLELLLTLRNEPHELLITYFGGAQRIVRTSADAYQFSYTDEEGSCQCQMTLVNGQGLVSIL